VWDEFVLAAAMRAEERGAKDWDTEFKVEMPQVPTPDLKAPGDASPKLDREGLMNGLRSASGPVGGGNQNPYWPNNPPQWVSEFGSRASNAIADAVDKAFQEQLKGSAAGNKAFMTSVAAYMNDVVSGIQKGLMQTAGSTAGLQRRADLLWWKEAAYSPSVKRSYRSFPLPVATLLMAIDLHRRVPRFCPESVEHFLREAIMNLIRTEGVAKRDRMPLGEILETLVKGNVPSSIQGDLAPLRQGMGRKPLVAFVADALANGTVKAEQFLPEIGIKRESTIELADFGVWVFRELQAIRAVAPTARKAAQKASE
jgi:hypothetical protein